MCTLPHAPLHFLTCCTVNVDLWGKCTCASLDIYARLTLEMPWTDIIVVRLDFSQSRMPLSDMVEPVYQYCFLRLPWVLLSTIAGHHDLSPPLINRCVRNQSLLHSNSCKLYIKHVFTVSGGFFVLKMTSSVAPSLQYCMIPISAMLVVFV